jgi:hypothetical protein
VPAAEVSAPNIASSPKISLREEDITDVSLSTFHLSDKEGAKTPLRLERVAYCRGCRCCGGCRRCRF